MLNLVLIVLLKLLVLPVLTVISLKVENVKLVKTGFLDVKLVYPQILAPFVATEIT